ncbi:lytic transglycosylase domain-containing protein [Pelomonas sp. SE-A7]|uniref:lytic transglycosylase domain-containing protein n=1 Tax=Pelomonas sp. SE-A7 TaxID=3054953 RepID=UPI00259CD344|nr:lytic transglycosylase domain-containing protein [Pelomonas sp. SE-A7]MDM4766706.1 transglycosylase SLT domain-containing protein [Pelomonas sp. SE-A7]
MSLRTAGRSWLAAWAVYGALVATPAQAATPSPEPLERAKQALAKRDRKQLALISAEARQQQYPLAPWIDYWELGLRLSEVNLSEVEAFYARWRGSYVEDRLRNDWLLELGHRRDWRNFALDYPRFRMNDDREVTCYALLTENLAGKDVKAAARSAWLAQKDGDEGCNLLATTLFEARKLHQSDVWLKLRYAVEANKLRAIKQAGALLGKPTLKSLEELQDRAGKFLNRRQALPQRGQQELTALALIRVASSDPAQAAELMNSRWERNLPDELSAWVWAQVGRQSAFKQQAEALGYFQRALRLQGKDSIEWSEDTLAWAARAALRVYGTGRDAELIQAIDRLGPQEARDTAWQYWRAHALLNTAAIGAPGDAQRGQAREQLRQLASPLHFYGKLAADELGLTLSLPSAPTPLSALEREQAANNPGLQRALALLALGWRSEGVREWNFMMRGLNDRELMAAAQLACEQEVWDRCISASERTKTEIDMAQRFPTPLRSQVLATAGEVGVDPAAVYGLIRQESRFVHDARSHVGASGLMQVMPATAQWLAKKNGIAYSKGDLSDRDRNLLLGTHYLKMVLDSFEGSLPMAAAAYNAGPSRPRRWRDGPTLDAAIWAETIPFNETRDYVKKVLSNTTIYAQLLGRPKPLLRDHLGRSIGPRETSSAALSEAQR